MIQVTLIKGEISQPEKQRRTLQGLVTKRHRSVRLQDTPAIRGMNRKVSLLVKVEEI